MNTSEKLNLKNLVREYKHESTTDKIRELKHSKKIREDIKKMLELKKKYNRLEDKTRKEIIEKQCDFLYNNYTNIFHKVYNDSIDLNLLNNFLIILKTIEDGKKDQHEASVQVGKILKQIYIDSAVREANMKDKKYNKKKKVSFKKTKNISWKEYKILNSS